MIKNFRSIPPRGVDLHLRPSISVLLGPNNAGKSNILDAIELLLGEKNPAYRPLEASDFNDFSQPILIEAEFGGLGWGDGMRIGLSDPQCAMLTKATKSKGDERPVAHDPIAGFEIYYRRGGA